MACHFSQRILTLTDLVGAETSCLETVTTCLATPRSTALVAVTLRSGKHFDAQPLSQEHHHGNNGDGCNDWQNDGQRVVPPPERPGTSILWDGADADGDQ